MFHSLNGSFNCRLLFISAMMLDFDECDDSSTNDCHINASCINSVGSFECICTDGFVGNGVNCSGELNLENWHCL